MEAKGSQSNRLPNPQGSNASGSSEPESSAISAFRIRPISHTLSSSATTIPPKMNSTANPTDTASARLTTKSRPDMALSGAGCTPSSGAASNSGSENKQSPKHQRP